MLKLHANCWYDVKGRGRAAGIEQLPEEFYENYYDPDQLMYQEVKIDGKIYLVEGVESFCISRSIDHPYRLSVGLLVKES